MAVFLQISRRKSERECAGTVPANIFFAGLFHHRTATDGALYCPDTADNCSRVLRRKRRASFFATVLRCRRKLGSPIPLGQGRENAIQMGETSAQTSPLVCAMAFFRYSSRLPPEIAVSTTRYGLSSCGAAEKDGSEIQMLAKQSLKYPKQYATIICISVCMKGLDWICCRCYQK